MRLLPRAHARTHARLRARTPTRTRACGVFMFVAVMQLSRGNRLSFKQQQMDSLRGRLLLALAEKDPTLLQ